jgi:hypothetical protein
MEVSPYDSSSGAACAAAPTVGYTGFTEPVKPSSLALKIGISSKLVE